MFLQCARAQQTEQRFHRHSLSMSVCVTGTNCGLVGSKGTKMALYDLICLPQDINAVEEAKKNLAARGNPMPEGYCQVVLMRPAREA